MTVRRGVVLLLLAGWWAHAAEAAETTYYRMAPDGQVTARTAAEWIAALNDPRATVRQEAASVLRWVDDAAARPAIPTLVQLLSDPDESVRSVAADTLQYLDPADAVPALREEIRRLGKTAGRHDVGVRTQRITVQVVGRLVSYESDEAIHVLIEVVQDRGLHSEVRARACEALGAIGARAQGATGALRAILEQPDEDPYVQAGASQALEQITATPAATRGGT